MKATASLVAAMLAALLVPSVGAALPNRHPDPSEFVARVANPWFPLRPRTTYVYRGVKDGQPSRDVFKVTARTRKVEGVRCTVARDRLYLGGRLEERTVDWYAQDRAGNVWYFGEKTAELRRDGSVRTTEGSWQAGVDGAIAGVFMPGHPHVGQSGRQELYEGHAEDHFRVLSLHAQVRTPAASSKRALLTREWTPLEPGVVDHKLFVRGVGNVREHTVQGGDELNVLVRVLRG